MSVCEDVVLFVRSESVGSVDTIPVPMIISHGVPVTVPVMMI
jgi:hypothetical protein